MEKYGTIPKRFTKDWWSYYWSYYKVHTIASAACAIILTTSLYQCATNTKYDLPISLLGASVISDESMNTLKKSLELGIDEITGNKNIDINIMTLPLADDSNSDVQYNYAVSMKFAVEMESADTDLYIYKKNTADTLLQCGDCFMDITEIVGDNFSDDMYIKDDNGRKIGLSLKGNKIFSDASINTEDMYISVKKLYERFEKKDHYVKIHQNSVKACKYLFGE